MDNKNICDMPQCSQTDLIQKINTNVEKMMTALLGNEFNGNVGFIQRQIELETKVKKLNGKIIYYAGTSVGIGVFIGLLISKFL